MEGARYLEDGRLTIFKREGSYYARIRLTGSARYLWRSLKTTNEQTAIDLGRRLLFQLERRAEEGLPTKSKLFSAVIEDYIAYREQRRCARIKGALHLPVDTTQFLNFGQYLWLENENVICNWPTLLPYRS